MPPDTHTALTVTETGKAELTDKPLPELLPDTVLVKVQAVALNPTDHKHLDRLLKPGCSFGSDFAGTVAAVGPDAEGHGLQVGDTVAGFVRGGHYDPANGSFQGFVRQHPELLWRVPAGLAPVDAAPMGGIALSTAAQGLYYRLNLPPPWAPADHPIPLLVWAGSTGVGMYCIQLAKASGLRVAATESPHNHALLRALGADAVFDYRDPDAPAQIREWAAGFGGLRHAFDTISEFGSAKAIAQAFDEKGGKVIRILPPRDELEGTPANVETQSILIYSVLKKENEKDFKDMAEWNSHMPELIESGKIKPVPRKHFHGGLPSVMEGLEYLRQGKASGHKITFIFDE